MDHKLNIFGVLTKRMDWLGRRQEVLARNVVNADTPDFIPHDMKPGGFERILARGLAPVDMAVTDSAHLRGGIGFGKDGFTSEEQKELYETSPSGNAVVIEEQMVKVAETQMDYQTLTNLYRKHMQMIRTAIGAGR